MDLAIRFYPPRIGLRRPDRRRWSINPGPVQCSAGALHIRGVIRRPTRPNCTIQAERVKQARSDMQKWAPSSAAPPLSAEQPEDSRKPRGYATSRGRSCRTSDERTLGVRGPHSTICLFGLPDADQLPYGKYQRKRLRFWAISKSTSTHAQAMLP
jgi:hypothetical protein